MNICSLIWSRCCSNPLTTNAPRGNGRMTMRNQIRFWHYHNGEVVRIKINAGQTLRHHSGGATDEGWSSESNAWTFDGETVTSQWGSDGMDCDGRLSSYGESFFAAADVASGYVDDEGLRFPKWEQGDSSQRDYSAEAMGY